MKISEMPLNTNIQEWSSTVLYLVENWEPFTCPELRQTDKYIIVIYYVVHRAGKTFNRVSEEVVFLGVGGNQDFLYL